MANQLNVAKLHSILILHERGWSQRRIARELGINRETVSRYVREASKPATNAPPGSAGPNGSKPATSAGAPTGLPQAMPPEVMAPELTGGAPAGEPERASSAGEASPHPSGASGRRAAGPSGPVSDCDPYRERILTALSKGLSGVRIHQDLRADHGKDAPSYHSVRRYIAKLRGGSPDPFRRIEVLPGVETQVDFGTGAPIIDACGKRHRTHVLRVVLSHSRKGYSEAVYRQTSDNFIRCIENAFHAFGGSTQTLVLDNLRAAVSKADWFDPEINPKVQSFMAHYGVVALPTKPRTPRHKGKVERGIAYVQDNALKGRHFTSLNQQNAHLRWWEAQVADTRLHGTTRQQVRELFEQVEKPALQPLPATRFPCFQEGRRSVHRDGHVEVAKAYYSVPPEYVGRQLWVRYDSRVVRVFDRRMTLIVTHLRKEPGQFSTMDQHILDRKIAGVERGAAWLLNKTQVIGPHARRWAEAMVQHRGIEGVRVLQGLIALANRQGGGQVNKACELALEHGCFRLRTIRELVRRDLDHAQRQQALSDDLIDEHPIIRPLSDYGRLVHEAFLEPLEINR